VFHGIPWFGVFSSGSCREVFFWPACSSAIAIIGANASLTGNAFVSWKACTSTCLPVTCAFVGAFYPRVKVIGVGNSANPREIFGASAKRAVGSSPFWFPVKSYKALAVIIEFTGSMV